MRGVEDYCWTQKVEILDRIQHAQKSVVNFAKRKLGMDVTEPNEPQKVKNCVRQTILNTGNNVSGVHQLINL